MGQDPLPLEFFGLLLSPLHLFSTAQYTLIILPSLIVLLSPSNNRPICPSSLAPASPPAALFSPSSALQWQVLIRELPRPLRYFSKIPPLPFPATFNLITGFLQLFRGGQSQEDNSRPSGFTNTLPRVIWFTRGGAFTLLRHQVPTRSACTVM